MNHQQLRNALASSNVGSCVLGSVRAPVDLIDDPPAGIPVDDERIATFDLVMRDGTIEGFAPPGQAPDALPGGSRMIFPKFVDMHAHFDMAHVVDVAPNPEGTHFGAVQARDGYRARAMARGDAWRDADLDRRMEFSARCAEAQGTGAVRTHLDSLPEQAKASWGAFERLRQRWRGRLELQAVALLPVDHYLTDYGAELADRVAGAGGVLGAVTRFSGRGHGAPDAAMEDALRSLLRLADARELDVDLHVDETGDPGARCLDMVARAVEATGFRRTVVCGHCCALAVRPVEEVEPVLARCRAAGLAVVSLPHCNLYLQDRWPWRTPRWRGITLLHELRAAGIPVAFGTDNCRDYFYAYGDQDMVSVFSLAALIGHLDRPYADWVPSICSVPARLMKLKDHGSLRAGAQASFVLFSARRFSELLARAQADRIVVRRGRAVSAPLPGFEELDGDDASTSPVPQRQLA